MPEFRQQKETDTTLYAEETDATLPEKLNPNTRYAYFSTIAKGGMARPANCKNRAKACMGGNLPALCETGKGPYAEVRPEITMHDSQAYSLKDAMASS